ncbi:oxygenase MpaB family protein [Arthrobacter antibioticus]|uniref:oxygenase MpaB family protein n=1 Tax=Arthrobacter sp. H35-MC1 TaxID=3046203 RepID=UPI0024BB7DC8|nr:oxygenase MpaB family protein [Arthrobacter sp. H35-MC1]MDJ0316200.1 oxygenase MpaB family protein [Arthrobacter sp. H35-MC1]
MTDTTSAAATVTDEGYFGPESVSWILFSDPSSKLGGVAAILMQALNPMMMRLFDQTSGYATDMEGRAERTGRYIDTTIFGDRAHADAAGTSVRRMHAHAHWTDPKTGMELRADNHDWLVWTHNTVVWGVLRGADAFGPDLTIDQQDTFIQEQHKAAELVGIDPSILSSTRAELDSYMDEQKSWMALTLPAAELAKGLRKPNLKGNPVKVWAGIIVQDGILFMLPDWARQLYGIEGRPMNLGSAARLTRRFIAGARKKSSRAELISEITERVSTHPYRKVRQR